MKSFDKTKDGKLDEDERAALRKAMSDRNSGKRSPGSDEKKRHAQTYQQRQEEKWASASVAEAIGASAVRAPPIAAEVNKPHIKN